MANCDPFSHPARTLKPFGGNDGKAIPKGADLKPL
jgi:hypothetical protein